MMKWKKNFYPGIKFEFENKEYFILSLKEKEFMVLEYKNDNFELIGNFNEKDLKIELEGNSELFKILNDLIKSEEFYPSTKLVL